MFAHMNIDQIQFPRLEDSAGTTRNMVMPMSSERCHEDRLTHTDQWPEPTGINDEKTNSFLAKMLSYLSDFFGVSSIQILGRRRDESLRFPRMVFLYLCVQHSQISYAEIGKYCSGRRADTVRRQCVALQRAMQEHSAIRFVVKDISLDFLRKNTP